MSAHTHGENANTCQLSIVLGLVGTFLVVEVVYDSLSGSLALLSDAGHMLTDAAALALSLFAINVLMAGVPEELNLDALRSELSRLPGVSEVHGLHVWSVTSGQNNLTAHLVSYGSRPTRYKNGTPPCPSLLSRQPFFPSPAVLGRTDAPGDACPLSWASSLTDALSWTERHPSS